MSNYTVLKNIALHLDEHKITHIQDIIKLPKGTFLFYDQKDIAILQNFRLKKIFRSMLPKGEEIKKVESLHKDLVAVGSLRRIIIFSIVTGKIIKEICFPDVEIQSFVFVDNKTMLFTYKQFIYKIGIFEGVQNIKDAMVIRTKLDQPICKILKQTKDNYLIQTYYENIYIFHLPTKKFTKYYYYDLPSRLFTDAVIFKNDMILSYSQGNTCLNRMNIKNGANYYIENDQLIHQIKVFDNEEQNYLVVSFFNGRVGVYKRKNQKEVAAYKDEEIGGLRNAVYPLKNNQLLLINTKYVQLVELEIVERNYCTFF